nr:nucleotide-binding protein [Actinospica robiniae]
MTEAAPAREDRARKVFVVHGRNDDARLAMFTFLRALDLSPIEWSEAITMTGEGSPYIGKVLEVALEAAQAIVVLLTPDDIAYLRTEYAHGPNDPEGTPQAQARPNVLFEAGMAMGQAPNRTVLVELGELRPFSDVAGRHAVRMSNGADRRQALAQRLKTAGCSVNTGGTDWFTAGDFTPPDPPGGGIALGKRVPSGTAVAKVQVDARYHDRANGGRLEIINQGLEDIYNLDVSLPEEILGFRIISQDLPLTRLPAGKSAHLVCSRTMPSNASHFDVTITGHTAEGKPIRKECFISLVG